MSGPIATPLDQMLDACATEIARRADIAEVHATQLRDGSAAFRAAVAAASPLVAEPSRVPVVDHLATARTTGFLQAVRAANDEIRWMASPRLSDNGTEAALAPLNEVRDFGDVTVGLLLVAPQCCYPEHSHAPQELYLPITGNADWRYGGHEKVRKLGPDALVYNHPNDIHAIYAGDDPVLALYVLWP